MVKVKEHYADRLNDRRNILTAFTGYQGKVEFDFREAIRNAAAAYSEQELRAIFEREIEEMHQ